MPAELDNMDPEMDQEMDASADMGSDPAAMGAEGGHGDQEGAMAKQELIKLANYATNLQEHIEDDEQLEAWVQSKITIAATNIASVYHYLAYEKKIGEYGEQMDSANLSESQRNFLKARLVEAKEKMKQLKKVQAEKMSEEFTDKSKVGDTFKTKTGVATKTDTGIKHTNTSYHDDGEAEEKSGKGIKTHAKAKDAATKKAEKGNDIKLPKHPGGTYGMKNGEKFDNRKVSESKMSNADMAHHHACEYAKHHKVGNLELAMHHLEECERCGGTIHHGPNGECCHTHPHLNDGQMYECGGYMMEAKSKMAKKDYDQDGKVESGKDEYLGSKIRAAKKAGKLKEGTCSVCKKDPCICKKEKKCNECGMYESKCGCDHSVKEAADKTMSRAAKGVMKYGKDGMKALAKAGKEGKDLDAVRNKYDKYDESAKWRDPKHKDKLYTQEPRDPHDDYHDDDYYNPKPDDYPGAKNLKGGGEYDHNDPLRKGYGRHGTGSPVEKGPRKGLPSRNHITSLKGSIKSAHGTHPQPNLPEGAKPSAGLSAAKKSAVVKDAKAGKDIGKPGKSFDKVAAKAGGGEKGKKIAAAAMWKNIKETTSYLAEKKKKEKMSGEGNEFSGALKKAREEGDTKMTVDGKSIPVKPGKSMSESADLTRMRELTHRLNVHEKTRLNENDEVNSLRKLSNFLKG